MLKKPKKDGYLRLINQATRKVKIIKHYNNGMVHGKIIYYWNNGQVHLTGQYNQMRRVGIWKTYNSNGDLILEENYDRTAQQESNKPFLFPINSSSGILPLNPLP